MGAEIISTITEAFSGTLNGTGNGIVSFFETLFRTTEGKITTIAVATLTMMGLGLGVWIMKKLLHRV